MWVSSDGPFLLFAPFIYVSHSSRESLISHLHHLCFFWPPTAFVPPSLRLALPSRLVVFCLVSSWVKGEAAEGGGQSAAEASQRAHSGHCVRARNNIYRSPLWAPWKQSQYWSPKWTYTAVFIVRSLSIKIRGGEKQLFQHIPWHLSAYWLFCQSCVHLLECLGSENIRMWIILIGKDNKCAEICSGDSWVETHWESRASGHLHKECTVSCRYRLHQRFLQNCDFFAVVLIQTETSNGLSTCPQTFLNCRDVILVKNGILADIYTVGLLNIRQSLDKDCSFHLKAEPLLTQTSKPQGTEVARDLKHCITGRWFWVGRQKDRLKWAQIFDGECKVYCAKTEGSCGCLVFVHTALKVITL